MINIENATGARKILLDAIDSHGMDLKSLSLRVGRNHAYLHQYINKGSPRTLPEDVRDTLAEILGIDAASLRDAGIPSSAPRRFDVDKIHEIPLYRTEEVSDLESDPIGTYPMRRADLQQILGPGSDYIIMLEVSTDRMAPTLKYGDRVLVNKDMNTVYSTGLYAIGINGELCIARCKRIIQSGAIEVSFDNEAYSSHVFDNCDEVEIIGRIKWIGSRIG